tara:strand:+ start:1088 stop:2170 length:1083 start_codon:yes stop_codon:yes gene_type:complete
MNIIEKILIDNIKRNPKGLSIDKFIEICLHNKNGYYKKKQPIGKQGDFITSPEISQLFGEIIGLYIYDIWSKYLNCKINLIELGPGKGTLINDVLRINSNFENFLQFIDLNLIEINDELIKLQRKNLQKFKTKVNNIQWKNNFSLISKKASIIIANEFFDCLGVKQYIKINNSWHERKIFFNKIDKKFYFKNIIVKNKTLINKLSEFKNHFNNEENQIVEISDKRENFFKKICKFIHDNYGIAIIIDYGYINPLNHSTLQSIRLNKKTAMLDTPGEQDITSLVNFQNFTEIAAKYNLNILGPISQNEFLTLNGIEIRKKKIMAKASSKQKIQIEKGFKRIVEKDEMGSVFKFLIVSKFNI